MTQKPGKLAVARLCGFCTHSMMKSPPAPAATTKELRKRRCASLERRRRKPQWRVNARKYFFRFDLFRDHRGRISGSVGVRDAGSRGSSSTLSAKCSRRHPMLRQNTFDVIAQTIRSSICRSNPRAPTPRARIDRATREARSTRKLDGNAMRGSAIEVGHARGSGRATEQSLRSAADAVARADRCPTRQSGMPEMLLHSRHAVHPRTLKRARRWRALAWPIPIGSISALRFRSAPRTHPGRAVLPGPRRGCPA